MKEIDPATCDHDLKPAHYMDVDVAGRMYRVTVLRCVRCDTEHQYEWKGVRYQLTTPVEDVVRGRGKPVGRGKADAALLDASGDPLAVKV
jgi:hypothetical protein